MVTRGLKALVVLPDISQNAPMTGNPTYYSFTDTGPKMESAWRGVILLGRNVQSYKFALARSLLELAKEDRSEAGLEELASPFSHYICEHLKVADRQGTPRSSKYLDACRRFLRGEIDQSSLVQETVRLGFNNVLDAFHTIGSGSTSFSFFEVTGTGSGRKIALTDDVFKLATGTQMGKLSQEIEARWSMVEAAWGLGVELRTLASNLIVDPDSADIVIDRGTRRILTLAILVRLICRPAWATSTYVEK